jgi:hypothetical protein
MAGYTEVGGGIVHHCHGVQLGAEGEFDLTSIVKKLIVVKVLLARLEPKYDENGNLRKSGSEQERRPLLKQREGGEAGFESPVRKGKVRRESAQSSSSEVVADAENA